MKYIKFIGFTLMLFTFLTGCMSKPEVKVYDPSKRMTAKEILEENENEDIFMLNGIIYIADVEWVNDLKITKKDEIGEIKSEFENLNGEFENNMATKLPIGSKIFSIEEQEHILLVQFKDTEKRYLAQSQE